MNKKPEIFVDYEYGDLKEVIVGVPYMIYPDIQVADWVVEGLKVLPASEAEKIYARSGKDSIEIGKYAEMEKENAELIDILEKHGIKVWRAEVLGRERAVQNFGEDFLRYAGLTQQYTRDPIVVIGENVIENAMGSLDRRCDILGLRRLFLERVQGSNARWVAMPALDYSMMIGEKGFNKTVFPVLEGGRCHRLGQKNPRRHVHERSDRLQRVRLPLAQILSGAARL